VPGRGRAFIYIRKLSHAYNEGTALEVRSLSSVSLEVRGGEVVGITGPNGSGKSTLLAHMNGLFRPRWGDVVVNGLSLRDPRVDMGTVRRTVGLVFQNPEDQLFERFVGDDVAFGPKNLMLPREEVRRRVREALDMVGLPFGFKDRLCEELSRGEKRRAALAGVLALNPVVLALDEPTANLDPSGKREVLDSLLRWKNLEKGRRAIVIVSHDTDELSEIADRMYLLVGGRVVLSGSRAEVLSECDVLAEHGVRIPFGVALMRALSRMGVGTGEAAVTVEDAARRAREFINGRI
jgi:energy-coupling factor transport system ATP-binding protein